ncbi:MAG TPA: hypothetical protein VME22_06950 [Solirubrobacteraceae bacterium]|nr:hypothetical protein [Solirubrobacteraceae bacterium]
MNEPPCIAGEHEWRTPKDLGFGDSALVRDGDRVVIVSVCRRCGLDSRTAMSVEDHRADDWSRARVYYSRRDL